jgi:hypothetical protein
VTLGELGSLGEFLAAIATLATLIYLAVQIRQVLAADIRQLGISDFGSILASGLCGMALTVSGICCSRSPIRWERESD